MRQIFFKFLDKDIGLRRRSAGRLADGVNLIVTGSLSFVLFCCAGLVEAFTAAHVRSRIRRLLPQLGTGLDIAGKHS